ncbi:uncharacterized protein CANTADRAFT_264018 [Suhomyces tanzawaensis NRRL Y-17324]|uniref:Uncharacterized protein n=1 Tax=Suhomyces tanzawaensis NRRL Y-17324 TaxID=984487 RepID=A0A1E4SFV7_9ASCO|nr:uncharacterized protein CANTADRAFT_264018 [Suhomyces tanzawaensis NRRL Y-17324]ODV78345.1 hypothetical protein CANTADRAFT_264018 [Suhomyces tanzawaensis NRRL Y-17324]
MRVAPHSYRSNPFTPVISHVMQFGHGCSQRNDLIFLHVEISGSFAEVYRFRPRKYWKSSKDRQFLCRREFVLMTNLSGAATISNSPVHNRNSIDFSQLAAYADKRLKGALPCEKRINAITADRIGT